MDAFALLDFAISQSLGGIVGISLNKWGFPPISAII